MFGGFGNNGYAVTGGYTPELNAIIARAVGMGYELPTRKNLDLMNELMLGLKAASVTGDLSPYSRISIYGNDINIQGNITGDLGFTGIWWNDAERSVTVISNITKTKSGIFRVNGRVDSGYNPSLDAKVSNSDLFVLWHLENELAAATNEQQGINGTIINNRLFLQRANNFRGITIAGRGLGLGPNRSGRNVYSLVSAGGGGIQFFVNDVLSSSNIDASWVKPNANMHDLGIEGAGNFDFHLSSHIIGQRTGINRTMCYNALINYYNKLQELST